MSLDLQPGATSSRRAAMVDRLTSTGTLTDPLLRDALLHVRRETLLPHAYVRVSGPGADPIDWRLLDGSHPDDREEWLDLIHNDASILLQRDGEPLDALARGPVTGGHMTSMSTFIPATVEALQTLGVGAAVVEGDALEGHEDRAPYDRIHSGIGVPCVPPAWVAQLAPGGRLLTTLATPTPSRPGQLLVIRADAGRIEAVLRGRPSGYRPMLGYRWLTALDHRARIKAHPGTARPTRLVPPSDDATVRVHGPRDVWAELEDLYARWVRADRPETYRVDLSDGAGIQRVTSGTGPKALSWSLPAGAAALRVLPGDA
ncbi:methyltransferase [Streptomyces sp. NRRL B-24572]|uniref:methyltransferase n=1 Tax=Streptomyces sp. NRRL B-24572 TaxID=1962156 RepID=UPI00211AF8D7|nr:methyltransferase [Streptomyces sp. NRRL B-24572]